MKKSNMVSLFDSIEKKSPESLFVIHNEEVAKMTVAEIFDSKRYTDFKAVSYVSSAKFFSDTVKNFKTVTFIIGIDNSENLNKFTDGVIKFFDSTNNLEFFNNLTEDAKTSLVENRMKIRYGKLGVMIHDKIYLLADESTKNYRVIIGSANFSTSAFDSENYNFENVRIDDSKKLYDIYLERFNYLLKQTEDYIPERCIRKYREEKVLLTVSPDTNFDLLFDKLQDRNFGIVITESQLDDLIRRKEIADAEKESAETTRQLITVTCKAKDADGKFRFKNSSEILAKKTKIREIMTLKKYRADKNSKLDVREVLLMDDSYKLYKKFDAQSDDMQIYSTRLDKDKIKSVLEKINAFTQSYYDFSSMPKEIFCSKIYEMILYAFTSPFIWKIRQNCATIYDEASVADIPMFCIVGGTSGSGKTTALKFVSILTGQTGSQIYDYSRQLDSAGNIRDLIKSNNVLPILADEIAQSFFRRAGNTVNKGEDMIKSLSNEVPQAGMGTLIGTTNANDFSSREQVIRRIYYLQVDNSLDTKDKKKSGKSKEYLRKIYDGLDDSLFRDFTARFAADIRDNKEIFTFEDFLCNARKIFLEYYAVCNIEVPRYFPRGLFNDYANKKVDIWRKLFISHKNCFRVKGDVIQVNIDEIFRNSYNVKDQKEKLLNCLDETCFVENSDIGVSWFLRKKEFFKFIDYEQGTFESVTNFLQRFLPGNG